MSTIPTLAEMRRVLAALPGPAPAPAAAADADGLGRLAELARWLAAWQGRAPARVERPRTAVFAASHGIAARLGLGAEATAARVAAIVAGNGAVNRVCRGLDADLRVYEMALEHPTRDFTGGAAMDEADCARAMAYGMMAVEPMNELVAVGEIGAGNHVAAAALAALLFGGGGADWLDGGAAAEIALVDAGIARHGPACGDPLAALARVGGPELAAIAGAILAARMARQPVVLDGFASLAAAAVLAKARPDALDHCVVAQGATGAAHAALLRHLGKAPLFDLGITAGAGVASTLGVHVLKAAVAAATEA